MGRTQAEGFAEAVDEGMVSLRGALEYHLTANHYPPLPRVMIDVAEAAIELANSDSWDEAIPMPRGIEFRGADFITVAGAVESLHLESFLTG